MSYKPKHLAHVNIFVRNIERSAKWYEDVLGLHLYDYFPERAAFLTADMSKTHEIALVEVGDDAPLPLPQTRGLRGVRGTKRPIGLNHMCFLMESLDDLKDLYRRLKEKNVPISSVADHALAIGIHFSDPDGNGIEVGYELPREQWPRKNERIFWSGSADKKAQEGRFAGPWDEEPDAVRHG